MSCQIFEYITDFSCHKDTAPQFISERYLKMRRQSYYSEDRETTVGYLMYNVSIGYPRKPTICKKQWHFNTTFKAMWTATLHRCQKRPAEVIHQSSERPLTSHHWRVIRHMPVISQRLGGEMMQSTWSNKSECLIFFGGFCSTQKNKKINQDYAQT